MRTTLFLPFPVTTNSLFLQAKKHRVKTKKYQRWINEATADFLFQKTQDTTQSYKHEGKVDIKIILYPPDNRKRDADNCLKCVLDFLVNQSIIIDDSNKYVQSIFVEWNEKAKTIGAFVVIEDKK